MATPVLEEGIISDSSQPAELSQATSASAHQISVRRDGMSDLKLFHAQDPTTPRFYVRNSLFRPGTPPVTLFSGGGGGGGEEAHTNGAQNRSRSRRRIIGVCHFPAFSHTIAVGMADDVDVNDNDDDGKTKQDNTSSDDMEWENVHKTSRDHSTYEFSFAESASSERRFYRWKRTHDSDVRGGGAAAASAAGPTTTANNNNNNNNASKWNMRSWKLEDCSTGKIVAVYAANSIKFRQEAGTFKFVHIQGESESESKRWEHWVLLTYLGISEKARRRAMARRDISWFF